MTTFGVVTSVPEAGSQGNLASFSFDLYQAPSDGSFGGVLTSLATSDPSQYVALMLTYMTPVFHLGEIIVLDDSGREVGYPGRKPSKWFITCEEFDNVEDAVARSIAITNESYSP